MKKTDLAYAAGIIDGEGCITIVNQRRPDSKRGYTYILRVGVASTDEWLPNWLRFSFGGAIVFQHKRRKEHNDYWSWFIVSRQADEFLKLVVPYLKLKRPQAELAIQFQAAKKSHGPLGKPKEEWAVEEAQAILMKSLKRKR